MADGFATADQARRLANMIRLGLVVETDLTAQPATVRVEIEDEWVTDALPVMQLAAGRVAAWSAPVIGEQVIVLAPSGDMAAGVALRGLPFDARPAPSDEALKTVLASWADGGRDAYDEASGVRRIDLADGGRVEIVGGSVSARIGSDRISLIVGAAELVIEDGGITLTADVVNLGGTGGQPAGRHNDAVVAGKVVATTTKVRVA